MHFEIGGKHTLAEGRLRLNWALWDTTIEDLQVAAFDNVRIVQTVTNAAEASSTGVELDIEWAMTDLFTGFFNIAYTDAVYDDFKNTDCYLGQLSGCVNINTGSTIQPDANGFGFDGQAGFFQDFSGQPIEFSPEMQFSVGLEGERPLGTLQLGWFVNYYWKDDQFLNLKHHPIYDLQEAYGLWDVSLSIGDVADVWRVSLVAKNLTDEIYSTFSNVNFPNPGIPGDAYISLTTGDTNQDVYYQFGAPGRQIGLQFLYNF